MKILLLIKKIKTPEGWDAPLMWVRAAPPRPGHLFEPFVALGSCGQEGRGGFALISAQHPHSVLATSPCPWVRLWRRESNLVPLSQGSLTKEGRQARITAGSAAAWAVQHLL